jgi:cytochrome c2
MKSSMPALVAGLVLLGGMAAEAAGKGPTPAQQKTLATCLACHDITPAKAQKVGPPLFGVVGAKPKVAGAPVKAWDKKALDAFLRDPAAYAKGSKMPYKVTDGAERAAIVKALAELK